MFFALAAALLVAAYSVWWFVGEERSYRLWYYVPAAALAGSLVADRFEGYKRMTLWRWIVDVMVALLCVARPLYGFPPASGHAIFSVHALLTRGSRTTLVLAVLSLLVTLYAKIVLWHWDQTLWPGLILGLLSGVVWRCTGRK
ncbi:MAG: hypothetical protein ACAH88_09210 [Roseimicrobium sp.]